MLDSKTNKINGGLEIDGAVSYFWKYLLFSMSGLKTKKFHFFKESTNSIHTACSLKYFAHLLQEFCHL